MSQPWSLNRLLYGTTVRWLLSLLVGALMTLGLLQRRVRRRADLQA